MRPRPKGTASSNESRGTSVLEATQKKNLHRLPRQTNKSCRDQLCHGVSCHVISNHVSYRVISCHVVSCHVVSCVSYRVVSKGLAISCRVMSRSVTSCRVHVVVPKRRVCASFFAKGPCQSHSSDSDQIANGTPASYLLILEVLRKKKQRTLGFLCRPRGLK